MFEVGKRYRTFSGKIVTILSEQTTRGYECVEGDDIGKESGETIWRYNRKYDYGRVCGAKWTNQDNLIPFAV